MCENWVRRDRIKGIGWKSWTMKCTIWLFAVRFLSETPKNPLHFCKIENIISHNVDSIL